ncbi:hypothetical protein EDC04DRAFT_2597449 [Pisolithus marmoratus]|nr:hypothetical protein EDC04DRAFT_2597449 [Pisolithus marmoratus]
MPWEVLTKCRINVKLGGINTIPDPQSVSILMDLWNLMIMMGADVIHPALGSEGCPLFTELVRNIDSNTAKYIATCHVQMSQKEIIEDLGEMAQKKTSTIAPTRLIFFGGSVSEGQFQEVLDFKLKALQAKCHHVHFFTMNPGDADRSGNCPAGMVIDQVVAHLVEFNCTCLLYCLHWVKNHHDPQGGINLSDTAMHTDNTGAKSALEAYKCNFKPLHNNMTTLMYSS